MHPNEVVITVSLSEYDAVEVLEAMGKLIASCNRGVQNSRNGTEWRNAMELRVRNLNAVRAKIALAYESRTQRCLDLPKEK